MLCCDRSIPVPHGPLRMRRKSIGPVQIGAHASDHAHAALLCRDDTFAEQVTSLQEFAVTVELHLGRIEGQDSGNADEDDVDFGGMPIVRPLLHVHDRAVILGHVCLTHAANSLLPRQCCRVQRSQALGKRDHFYCCPEGVNVNRVIRMRGTEIMQHGARRKNGSSGCETGLQETAPVQHDGSQSNARARAGTKAPPPAAIHTRNVVENVLLPVTVNRESCATRTRPEPFPPPV